MNRFTNKMVAFAGASLVCLILFTAVQDHAERVRTPFFPEPPLTTLAQKTPLKNGVTALIAAIRPFDTLGGVLLIFCSIVAVRSLSGRGTSKWGRPYESTILSIITGIFFPLCLVFAAYLLCYGTNQPGGGAKAGIMLAAGAILYFLALGHRQFREQFHPELFIPTATCGLFIFLGAFLPLSIEKQAVGMWKIFIIETGLLISVGSIMIALFWALAAEEGEKG